MKVRGIAVLCLLAMTSLPALAQEKKPEGEHAMGNAEMEAMAKAGSPGEQHKHLARMAGDWTYTSKAWMAPGQPPVDSNGTMHADLLLGGRYVEHHWKGDFMGMPFEGRGTEGYDNMSKQYISSWIDNMSTGIMMSTGSCDAAGNVCTLTGDSMDPMSGQKMTMKTVITWNGNDSFKNEMFVKDPSGNEMKMMEIVATRKK
jgi:hypothetical protein